MTLGKAQEEGAVKGFEDWQRTHGYEVNAESAEEVDAELQQENEEPQRETGAESITEAQLVEYENEDPLNLLDDSAHGQLAKSGAPDVTETRECQDVHSG